MQAKPFHLLANHATSHACIGPRSKFLPRVHDQPQALWQHSHASSPADISFLSSGAATTLEPYQNVLINALFNAAVPFRHRTMRCTVRQHQVSVSAAEAPV
jgi:hypothetical protein